MNWGILEKWRECVASLKEYDTTGPCYRKNPFPHYAGNFWWSKSSHIRKLHDPIDRTWWYNLKNANDTYADRLSDEMWVCSLKDTKSYDITNLSESHSPPRECWPKYKYEETIK